MVIEPKKTFLAYRCPSCGQAVLGIVGAFALKTDMLRLRCTCGGSYATITVTPDKKIRLAIPCMFCNKDHSFVLSQELFFQKDSFLLNCPNTGVDIGFTGSEQNVRAEVTRNENELKKMFADEGVEFSPELFKQEKSDEDSLPDAQIYDIVRFVVKELEADGAIDCPCHGGTYDFEMVKDGIRIFCPECDAEYIFPADSVTAAQDFLHCDHLELK